MPATSYTTAHAARQRSLPGPCYQAKISATTGAVMSFADRRGNAWHYQFGGCVVACLIREVKKELRLTYCWYIKSLEISIALFSGSYSG
jgi:hypothetical protein